jgi:predicted nucleotidyltransferase component of viral defense system
VTPNTAASVHQRLLNRARAEGRPFNELLQRFALERFLYRLGQSAHRSRFVLKGAMMLSAWQVPSARPTRDVDLLGRLDNTVEAVSAAIRDMCQVPVPDDGLRFDAESVAGERIVEQANYAGVRLRFTAYLGRARIPMQVDVGFGDPVVPAASAVRLAPILDFPPPEVQGYSRESTIAEKYQIMIHLGSITSRMKDFYDIWSLAGHFAFEGPVLARAIEATFRYRATPLVADPVWSGDLFAGDPEKQLQWAAFIRRLGLAQPPATLRETMQLIARFLGPVTETLLRQAPFDRTWVPGGPWQSLSEGE